MAIQSLEQLNANMIRKYPLTETCTVGVPDSFIVDIEINYKSTKNGTFYISSVDVSQNYAYITIGFTETNSSNGSTVETTTGYDVAMSSPIPLTLIVDDVYASHKFDLIELDQSTSSDLLNITGSIIIGSCVDIKKMSNITVAPASYATSAIVAARVNKQDSSTTGINSVTFLNDDTVVATLTEDFILAAGDGIEFEIVAPSGSQTLYTVKIKKKQTEAEEASGLSSVEDVVLKAQELFGGIPITKINGVDPINGEISIKGAQCTDVNASTTGLTISNPCSTPCCSDSSVTDIAASIKSLEEAKERLINYFEALSTNINVMQTRLASVIASK